MPGIVDRDREFLSSFRWRRLVASRRHRDSWASVITPPPQEDLLARGFDDRESVRLSSVTSRFCTGTSGGQLVNHRSLTSSQTGNSYISETRDKSQQTASFDRSRSISILMYFLFARYCYPYNVQSLSDDPSNFFCNILGIFFFSFFFLSLVYPFIFSKCIY